MDRQRRLADRKVAEKDRTGGGVGACGRRAQSGRLPLRRVVIWKGFISG